MKRMLILVLGCAACGAPVGESQDPLLATVSPDTLVLAPPRDYRVATTADELLQMLAEASPGSIYIPDNVAIDLSGHPNTELEAGVELWSDRGGTREGGMIFSSNLDAASSYEMLRVVGDDVHIHGLRLRGPSQQPDKTLGTTGIRIDVTAENRPRRTLIENNEIYGWTAQGVYVQGPEAARCVSELPTGATRIMTPQDSADYRIVHNYIHDNVMDGMGYGVNVGGGAYATIDGNVFDYNRHAVASDGRPWSGYLAFHNYMLEGGHCEGGLFCSYNQHFDVHGCDKANGYRGGDAGEYYDISFNTVRGDQSYDFTQVRAALWLRGTPTEFASFHDNKVVHDNQDDAIRNWATANYWFGYNTYDFDPSTDLAAADLDGDGRDDVVMSTGTGLFYSSAGIAPWQLLSTPTQVTRELAFGHFDGDARADVFAHHGGHFWWSSGGTAPLTVLSTPSPDYADLHLGNFDDDPRTDVFARTPTGEWVYSSGGTGPWTHLQTSSYAMSQLRFGDFDGDGITDVFAIEDGHWSWSRSARGSWQPLNALLSSDLGDMVFADFDGDGRTDIALQQLLGWSYSSGGRSQWQPLRSTVGLYWITRGVVGKFNGDAKADVLEYGLVYDPAVGASVPGRSFALWSGNGDAFTPWSRHPMR